MEDEYPDLTRESKAMREFVTFRCRFWAAEKGLRAAAGRRRKPV
jgi:hypothetical protein